MEARKQRRPRRVLHTLAGVVVAVAVVLSVATIKVRQFGAMGAAAAQQVFPPERVNVVEVRREQWQPRVSSVGSVVAVEGTVVSAEAEGIVRDIRFEAGSTVRAGDMLVQLDVEIERAQLRSAEATAELARTTFARAGKLIAERTISQADFDQAQASVKQADAQVDNIRAVIAKKAVRAPFGGKVGIRRISVGEFLQKGSPIVSLQALDPVYVEFSVPQQRFADLAEGLTVEVSADSYPGQRFTGPITAIDPDIDPVTRSVRLQATLNNADGRLRPGMFVSVAVELASSNEVLVIPATAVQHAPFGDSIFVVEESGDGTGGDAPTLVVRQKFVRLGARRGDFVVALDGAEVGEKVVSTGVFKLRPGMPVVIDNTLAPDFKLAPEPANT